MEDQKPSLTVAELNKIIDDYLELQDKKAEISAELKEINKEIARVDTQLVNHFKEHGMDKSGFSHERGKFTVKLNERVTMPKTLNDKEALFNWLRERNLFDAYATINSNSLNSLFKEEKAKAVEDNPAAGMTFTLPGIEPPSTFEQIQFRKTRGTTKS